MSEYICLNVRCYTEGRCDFCDARCPDFTDAASLVSALKNNEHGREIKEVAHDLYMEKCEQDAEKYRLYMQWCNDCPKAYDFTCSGADVKKCEQEKQKLLTK